MLTSCVNVTGRDSWTMCWLLWERFRWLTKLTINSGLARVRGRCLRESFLDKCVTLWREQVDSCRIHCDNIDISRENWWFIYDFHSVASSCAENYVSLWTLFCSLPDTEESNDDDKSSTDNKKRRKSKVHEIKEESQITSEFAQQLDLSCMSKGLVKAPSIANGYIAKYNRWVWIETELKAKETRWLGLLLCARNIQQSR